MPPDMSRLYQVQSQIQTAQSAFQSAGQVASQSQDGSVQQAFSMLNDAFYNLTQAISDMCDVLTQADFTPATQ
jgi:hypothetical protein